MGGGNSPTARASLLDMCAVDQNPIVCAQDRIVERLQAWGEEGPVWSAVRAVGVRFDDHRCALLAKRELLALAAGLVDHFEIRLSALPYSLISLISPAVSAADQRRIAYAFLQLPEHCLTEFCRRLRALFPTVDALLLHGRGIIEAWAQGSFVEIGRTERSHGAMRQELHSEHRARSFTASANHSVCSELKSAHMRRGGTDPLKAGVAPAAEGALAAGVPPSQERRAGIGGRRLSSYLAFRNQQFQRYKASNAADRPMTGSEMGKLQDKCLVEWRAMGEAGRHAWQMQAEAKHLTAIVARHTDQALVSRKQPLANFVPWAG
jgi:hypothetical protein